MSDLEGVLDKYVRQLRTSPEPARMFIITALFQCIDEYCSKDLRSTSNRKSSLVKDVIEECMSVVGNDVACLSAVVGHMVGLVERSRITSQEGHSMLMAGLASGNVIVHVVSNGIMDMYEMSIGQEESPSLVHAWVLEPESAVTFVSRIEAFLTGSISINRETILEYWRRVHVFLAALVMRPGVSKGKDMVSVLDVGARVRSMLVRLGCHGKVSSRDVVEFLIKAMLSYDVTEFKRAEELEACTLDIVDVLLLSENDEGHDVIPKFLQACFIVSIKCLEVGHRAKVYLDAMTHFLPEFGSCCYEMMVRLVIRGMECGEAEDAEVCFTVVCMILNSPDALLGHGESEVVHLLSMVECACIRAKFYAQKPGLKQSIQFCVSRIHTLLSKFHDDGATRMVEWDGDVLCWIQKISIAPLCVMNEGAFHVDLVYTRVLCLLRHPCLRVRRRVLEDAFISLAEEPRFSFYALPVLLERLERFDTETKGTGKKEQGVYMRDLLYALASLSRSPSAVPFIVRALTPFADPQSPSELQGIACSILRRMWLESRKGYSSLKLMILSCDMEDGVEIRADTTHRWIKDVPPQEKVGVAAALVSICRDDPGKAKDVVHAIHACVCSKYTCLSSSGLSCITLLCESDVLDFIKSWNVVRRVLPDLPDDDVVAASWIGLIACVLKEDPEMHGELIRNTINLLWEASAHESDLVRVQAYRALEKLDWDISEDLETLRRPIEYAKLLEQEEPGSKSLEDCGTMMVKMLELEYLDRRKQFIQLSSTLSNLSKQSHSSRFYKLSNAIPNHLLKEATGGRHNFMKSGSESDMFIMLYLWQPAGKKTVAVPEMYRRVADDMLTKDSSMCLDLLMDFENIIILSEGWEHMYRRWIRAFSPEDIVETSEYHKYTSEIGLIWQQITKDNRLSEKVLNPIIVIAISSFVRVFGRVDSQYVMTSYTWITRILGDSRQFSSLQTVSVIALGRILGHARQSLGSSIAATAMDVLLSGDDERLGDARDFALQYCTDKAVSLDLAQQAFDHLKKRIHYIFPSLKASFAIDSSKHENQALKSFGSLVSQTNAFDCLILPAVLSEIEDIFASGSHEHLTSGLCDLYCSIAIKLFEDSQLNDSRITKCLDMMSSLCDREGLAKYVGDLSLALSKLLVGSLKNGYAGNSTWNMDTVIEFMKDLLSKVHKYPCVQSNAGAICRGLGHCLEYQMYNQKSINESFVQENRAETVIDTICHMESSNAIKTGCIPHISRICHMAIDFRTRFETDSFESMSGSAVGYLSEALISQQWPHDGKKTLHKQQVMTLLSCLSHAPKLPQKDWSACLRRYVKMFPEDIDVQVSIVKFVCSHATGSIADKIRDFVCVDALNLGGNVLQPKTLMLEALCYIFCHLSDIIPLLSDDQVLLYLNSLDNAFSIDTRRSKLIAFSLAFGLQTFVTEIDNISQTALAYELMIQVLLPRVDMSSRFHAPLCALYSQSDEELTAVALRREDWVFEDNILVETPEINIERNASIAACLLRAIRSADTATQVSITQNQALFKMHPMHHSWISCGLIQSLGIQSVQQSLYHVMACVSSTDNSVAHQMISNMAHGIHILVRNSQPSKSKDVLTWLADIFGDEKKHMEKTESNKKSPMLSQLAVMCIAACYAGEVGHSAAYDLSLDESIMLLPKALSHFMKHQPSHQSVYRHLIRCLDDIDRPNMDLIRVSLSTLYVDQSDWLDILQQCS